MTLQLEYRCTEAEMKAAQQLQQNPAASRQPKWVAKVLPYLLIILVVPAFYYRIKTEVAPKDLPLFIGFCIAIYFLVIFIQRLTPKKTGVGTTIRLEASDQEVVISGDGAGRSVQRWSGFSQCLESAELFVLVDHTKTVLYPVPKRVFPNEDALNWFRTQAKQPRNPASEPPSSAPAPDHFTAANGLTLTWQLRFWDYLERNLVSWRLKGMFLGVFVLYSGMIFLTPPSPNAVNSPTKVFLISMPMFLGMTLFAMCFFSLIVWHAEKKIGSLRLLVTAEGIEFAGQHSRGLSPWTDYKYYHETRWSFFIWQPQGSIWFMIPKRAFTSPADLDQCRALLQTKLKRSRWFVC